VGHETLADSFGEYLYCRGRPEREEVECPICGRWAKVSGIPWRVDGKPIGMREGLCCSSCSTSIAMAFSHDRRWGVVQTKDLLDLSPPPTRFFFPRAWNEGKNWIEYDALKTKYNNFQKDKDNAGQ
jgi:hypothetical protein